MTVRFLTNSLIWLPICVRTENSDDLCHTSSLIFLVNSWYNYDLKKVIIIITAMLGDKNDRKKIFPKELELSGPHRRKNSN